MSWGVKFNLLPKLAAKEEVLYFKNWVWAASGKSLPYYRWFFSLPPLWEGGLYVTDRRVLFISHLCRLLTFESSQWFEGVAQSDDEEFVRDVSVGRHRVFGPFLEVVSHNPAKPWYRSHELRGRFFMRHPESAREAIREAMAESREGG